MTRRQDEGSVTQGRLSATRVPSVALTRDRSTLSVAVIVSLCYAIPRERLAMANAEVSQLAGATW